MYIYAMFLLRLTFAFRFVTENHKTLLRKELNSLDLKKLEANKSVIPYLVQITFKGQYCSGSLIGSRIVLTAASCMMIKGNATARVKLGVNLTSNPSHIIPVIDTKIHEYYRLRSVLDNDIAILFLKDHVWFNEWTKKIVLMEPNTALKVGVPLLVSGWSYENDHTKMGNKAIWSEMHVMDNKECHALYPQCTVSSFCAKFQPEFSLSDHGGPAAFNDYLAGILQASRPHMHLSQPKVAIFTNVSYFYRWIKLNFEIFLKKYCKQSSPQMQGEYYRSD